MAGTFSLLPVLLLALFSFSVSGQSSVANIVSINCGGTTQFDSDTFITWTSDDDPSTTGDTGAVRTKSISPVMDTLRYFPYRKKACYSYDVTKGQKVMVRASFYYGNYDGLSKPPTFDLHFDGNFWTTVETLASGLIYHEATFVAKGSTGSVCVAKSNPDQIPFISAVEAFNVDSEVYSDVDQSRALFLNYRYSCGATQNFRDDYGRIWERATAGTKKVASEATILDIDATGPNNPPMQILETACTVDTTSQALALDTIFPANTPVYINTYFSEIINLESTETRSFIIQASTTTKSGPLLLPISPAFGRVVVRALTKYTVDSITNLSLVATVGSDYPPLINAIESFNISETLTDGTYSNDVEALALLQTTFDSLYRGGDPCLPAPYTWDWVNCSNDATPRITALYLDGYELSGSLPDFSSMDALEIINLHNNNLTGTIPSFLGNMPKLQQLNLADNLFSGSIPSTISKNKKIKLTSTGNPSLCASGKSCATVNSSPDGTTTTKSKKSGTLPVVLGITIPVFFLVWVAAGIFIILRRRRKTVLIGTTNGGGGSNGLNKIGENVMHQFTENVAQQTFGSPAPLFPTSGQTSDQYEEETGVRNT